MRVPADHSGRATIAQVSEDTSGWRTLRVRAVNTADYVGGLVEGRSFGIKIDIEGAEPAVLSHILGRKGLRFVVFEGDRNQQMLFDLFTTANFAIYGLRKTVIFPEVERVSNMTEWGGSTTL